MARLFPALDPQRSDAVIVLPPRLDVSAACGLAQALKDRAGADLVLDVTAVTHLGVLCLQMLRAAAHSWQAAGHCLTLTGTAPALDDTLTLYGITRDLLTPRAEADVAA